MEEKFIKLHIADKKFHVTRANLHTCIREIIRFINSKGVAHMSLANTTY
jgi:hypothetical protein